MKSIRQCSDAEVQTREIWSSRVMWGLFVAMYIGLICTDELAQSYLWNDYPAILVLVGIAVMCLMAYLYNIRIMGECEYRTHRQIHGIIVLLDKVPPDSD